MPRYERILVEEDTRIQKTTEIYYAKEFLNSKLDRARCRITDFEKVCKIIALINIQIRSLQISISKELQSQLNLINRTLPDSKQKAERLSKFLILSNKQVEKEFLQDRQRLIFDDASGNLASWTIEALNILSCISNDKKHILDSKNIDFSEEVLSRIYLGFKN